MSSICGIISRNGQSVSPESITRMVEELNHWHGDRTGTWINSKCTVAMGQVMLQNTPESLAEVQPFHHKLSDLTITADARIDNRDELLSLLDIPPDKHAGVADSQLILRAYQKWGRKCVEHLLGDFAFAIWDEREKRLFCSKDQIGMKPFYYYLSHDYFIFASELKGIFTITGVPGTLNSEWVVDALTALVADKTYTPYPGFLRLPPAHWLTINPGGIRKEPYWQFDPEKELHLTTVDDYVESFREKLTEAVRCRMRTVFPIGSELSGGLDSSAVSSLVARHARDQNIKMIAFSHQLDEADKTMAGGGTDEREFADALMRHAGIQHAVRLYARDRGLIETLKQSLHVQDGPTMLNFYNYSDVLYEAGEKEGIRTLFSGFGGDEVVSIEAGGYLNELVENCQWRDLWHEYRHIPDNGKLHHLRNLLVQAAFQYAPFLKTLNHYFRRSHLKSKENKPDFQINTFSLTQDFFKTGGVHKRLATIPRFPKEGSVRNVQYRRITHPHVPLRLEYSSIAAASRRIEYRYPLLDIRLLEFHLAVPSSMKRKEGYGRYLFRLAIEEIVPPMIQWRQNKSGFTIPAARPRFNRDAQAIAELIAQSRNQPGAYYLDLDKMLQRRDRIIKSEKTQHPTRSGAYLNALMLLLFLKEKTDALHY